MEHNSEPKKHPFSASDTESMTKLAEMLANDKKFADSVAAHKPGDEVKLKAFLEGNGFKGMGVRIYKLPTSDTPPPPPQPVCYEVCLCSTVVKGLCICIRYCT